MKTAVIQFSGGVDSTYVAYRKALKYDRIILITYITPGMINAEFSKKSTIQLKQAFKNRFEHRIIDIRNHVNEVRGGFFKVIEDNMKYQFYYSWCMGCKVGMHLYTLKYCCKHGIRIVLDGSNAYDDHALEQHIEVKKLIAGLYKKDGITYLSPFYYEKNLNPNIGVLSTLLRTFALYKDSTDYRVNYLEKHGINLGKGFVSQFRETQPSCLTSLCFNIPRTIFKAIKKEDKEKYLRYIEDKVLKNQSLPQKV